MRTFKRFNMLTLTLSAVAALTGFSGPEKYIELGAALYGRSSAQFFYEDRSNIEMVLPEGTRGEIVERTRLDSGNYGYQIQVMNGENIGKKVWVFYNMENPDLTLYSKTPKRWTAPEELATPNIAPPTEKVAPEKAAAVQTIRDTPGIKDPKEAKPAQAPAAPQKSGGPRYTKSDEMIRKSFQRIEDGNDGIKSVSTPKCTTCSVPDVTSNSTPLSISRGSKGMDNSCNALMSSSGQVGSTGRALQSIMSESQYKSYFMRNDSLGRFCPKFRNLTPTQKMQAWTWFWTSLAQEESSCDPQLIHPVYAKDRSGRTFKLNPNVGYGLWAMEKDANLRRGRGAPCSTIATAEGQARCAVEIMTATQLAKGRNADVLSGSYWGPVMRGNAQIMPHMRRLNICF